MSALDIEKLRKQFEEDYAAAQMPAESDWFRLDEDGEYFYSHTDSAWEGYQLATRRAAQQPSGGDVLTQLPEDEFCAWIQHGKAVNAFNHGVGDPRKWDHDGYFASRGYHREPLYTVAQVRQAQNDAIATHIARTTVPAHTGTSGEDAK